VQRAYFRLRAGAYLALEHPDSGGLCHRVPDSGIDAHRLCQAKRHSLWYGFIKTKYMAHVYSPGQKSREDKVKIKLNPLRISVRGKRRDIIDIPRARTTSARITKVAARCGRGACAYWRIGPAVFKSMLLWHGHRIARPSDRLSAQHCATRPNHRGGFVGVFKLDSAKRMRPAAAARNLHACLRPIPHRIHSQTHKNRFEQKLRQTAKKRRNGEKEDTAKSYSESYKASVWISPPNTKQLC
jgi:amidophosphoribosyltransferase